MCAKFILNRLNTFQDVAVYVKTSKMGFTNHHPEQLICEIW